MEASQEAKTSLESLSNELLYQIASEYLHYGTETSIFLATPDFQDLRISSPDSTTLYYRARPLKSFSMVNSRMRTVAGPLLFRTLDFSGTFKTILTCLADITTYDIVLFGLRKLSIYIKESENPISSPLQVPHEIPTLILKAPHLQMLALSVTPRHAMACKVAFDQSKAIFPSIRILGVGMLSHWLIRLCPEVTTILAMDHIDDEQHLSQMNQNDLISELHRATYLKGLKMSLPESFTINTMLKAIPQIESLDFGKCVGGNTLDLFQQAPGQNFRALLSSLRGFRSLKLVAFPDISTLGIGYKHPEHADGVTRPDNTKTEDMMTLSERVEKEMAEHNLARDIFVTILSLECVYFGIGKIKAWKRPDEEGKTRIYFWHKWDVPPSEEPHDDGFNTVIVTVGALHIT